MPLFLALALTVVSSSTHDADGMFERYSNRVVQVRVTSKGSDTKAVIGTGFFVAANGTLITNYHVVSYLLLHPERYQIRVVEHSGAEREAQLLDVDVLNDLAILKAVTAAPAFFDLTDPKVPQGARLFSLGNPHDVGMSIVEGTYNGLIAESLYEQIHFTGSLNSGVSGGPAIDSNGNVVGVNVASRGDQLSFLVPVKFARALLERVTARGGTPFSSVKERVGEQLLENQERLSRLLLDKPPLEVALGPWHLPGRWLPQLREWGTQDSDDEDPWVLTDYQSHSDHAVYVNSERQAGSLWLYHRHVQAKDIGSMRLYALWGKFATRSDTKESSMTADRETATNWRCETRFVRNPSQPMMQVSFCIRGFKPFAGLYDVIVRVLTYAQNDALLVGEFGMGGFTADNARELSKRFLETITWKP